MGKTITTLVVLAIIIAGGIWFFNRNDNNLATGGNATSTDNLTGTGGPEDNYNPLEDYESNTEDNTTEDSKG